MLEYLGGMRFVVSLDCDGLDPSQLAAVRAPLPGGLRYEDAVELLVAAIRQGGFSGMVVTELAPALDPSGLAALLTSRLISNVIGVAARAG
ncbi:hypothetical protein BH20CHL6_BH20CHL6_07460 [soil metagenome]